jgi:restriction system protein
VDSVTIHSNNLENIVVGALDAKWSARGDRILRYYIDVRHRKLNLHKEVSAPEIFILQSKLDALIAGCDVLPIFRPLIT